MSSGESSEASKRFARRCADHYKELDKLLPYISVEAKAEMVSAWIRAGGLQS